MCHICKAITGSVIALLVVGCEQRNPAPANQNAPPGHVAEPTWLGRRAVRSVSVPAEEAQLALEQVAGQFGVDIAAAPEDLAGVHTRAVSGEMSLDEAMRLLLDGTGLTYVLTSDGGVLWKRARSQPAPPSHDVVPFERDRLGSPGTAQWAVVYSERPALRVVRDSPRVVLAVWQRTSATGKAN